MVVDDLHHADEDTLVLIGFLVRRLVDLPIMWVLTSRPEAGGAGAWPRRAAPPPRARTAVSTRWCSTGCRADDIARLAEAAVGRSAAVQPVAAP